MTEPLGLKGNRHAVLEFALEELPRETWPILSGWAAFGSTLALSTWTQLHPLGISTGTRPIMIPSAAGFATVCAASVVSHQAAMLSHEYCQRLRKRYGMASHSIVAKQQPFLEEQGWKEPADLDNFFGPWSGNDVITLPGGLVQIPKSTLGICLVGLVAFKLLRGRFWAISASSYTDAGAFARRSIPATAKYATKEQRDILRRMLVRTGCHTCGTRRLPSGSRADHIPPNSVVKQELSKWYRFGMASPQKFYPQCVRCSNRQGELLAVASNTQKSNKWSLNPSLALAGRGSAAHFHGLRFRPCHWAGGVVAGLAVVGASDNDIQSGNPRRFQGVQNRAENLVRQFISF